MIEIDGAQYSGSGTIVRHAVMWSALTGRAIHIVNVRARRPKPGLRHQHVRVVAAVGELVNAKMDGVFPGSRELRFEPGSFTSFTMGRRYVWDIGSAGSTTMLALAVLPILLFAPGPVEVELRGGLFQDCAPSVFHLQHAVLPLLRRMGAEAAAAMNRPGYVPRGEGILRLQVRPHPSGLRGLECDASGGVRRIWGVALASHLAARRVAERMAETAAAALQRAGHASDFEIVNDTAAMQPGAALAAFADLRGGARLGADRAGALGRSAESIGRYVAAHLLEDLTTGATLDRFATDQMVPFAVLANGESRFGIATRTEHLHTNVWLARLFLNASIHIEDTTLRISGTGFEPPRR